MTAAICSVFYGDYHYGFAALANSLAAKGFKGPIYVGIREDLPFWARTSRRRDNFDELPCGDACSIRFLRIDTGIHPSIYKIMIMRDILRDYEPDADAVYYFDPDITVTAPWAFFDDWLRRGSVTLIEDLYSPFAVNHPIVLAWSELLKPYGWKLDRGPGYYVNGGFAGVSRSSAAFIDKWIAAVEDIGKIVGGLGSFRFPERVVQPFQIPDQDALNVVIRTDCGQVSIADKAAMGLRINGYLLSHTCGIRKPWHDNWISQALRGWAPTPAMLNYFNHVETPIRLYSPRRRAWLRRKARLAMVIGYCMDRRTRWFD